MIKKKACCEFNRPFVIFNVRTRLPYLTIFVEDYEATTNLYASLNSLSLFYFTAKIE